MKKILYIAAAFAFTALVACEKESNDDLRGTVSTGVYNDYNSYNNHEGGGQCGFVDFDNPTTKAVVADFTIDNQEGKVDEQATLLVSNKSTNAVSYEWDFGNGDKSTEANPTYSYKMHGNYTVTLKAKDQSGKVSTSTKQVTVLCIFGGGPHDE
ncbi:MAG: PKD domain-containing protein [Saprospiraceae bacterium]|nr:PKD domain-containing protein [Saprospiraceae bacterium]